jgi:hypothetical protein
MAFVSIDNPAGIQHHGGQMDWCRISPTRVAIVTFTVDNKALVQEVNYNAGATELGPASFLKQVTLRSQTNYTYLKPRIKSLGNDKLFIMVPASFAQTPTAAGTIRNVGTADYTALNATLDIPLTHTCIVAVRNADGTYTVDSQIDTRTQNIAEGNSYPTYGAPIDIDVNPNGLQILLRQPVGANNVAQRLVMKNTLTLAAGKLTAQAVVVEQAFSTQPQATLATAVREVLTPQLVPLKIYSVAPNFAQPWVAVYNAATAILAREYFNPAALDSWPAAGANATGNFLNLNAYLPIDIAAKTFLYTGGRQLNLGGNCYLNNNLLNAGAQIVNPLDSAWVTNDVAAVIGMAGEISAGENPATFPTPVYDHDAALSLNPLYHATPYNTGSSVRRLSIAFKKIVGGGLYVGPFDPVSTPYFTKDFYNRGAMIHRINDTAFWVIGCFREGAAGADKLGVITVKA